MSEKEPELGENVSIETKDVIETLKRLPRSSWGEYFMMQAFLAASRSPSEKLKVGAIIVPEALGLAAREQGAINQTGMIRLV